MASPKKTPPPKEQFGIRLSDTERAFFRLAAETLSATAPTEVGLGPYLVWAGKQQAAALLGMSFAEFEEREGKRGKGGSR